MTKIKKGDFIFFTWKGDHSPYHVHIFKNNKLFLKWNLEENLVMEGKITKKLRKLIDKLCKEGMI